jgi:hypothetical protein
MIKSVPLTLKTTPHIDIFEAMKKFITSQYDDKSWKSVEPIVAEMQKLRSSVDYTRVGAQISNDYRLCEEVEQVIIKYIRYVYMIDYFFKGAFHQPKNTLLIPFMWTDSLIPSKKIQYISSAKYELINCLYNLSVVYYTEASYLSTSQKEEDKIKSVAKLRNAIWCLNEIKLQMPQLLLDPTTLPTDLDPTFLTILTNYFVGLSYNILLTILEVKKPGEIKLASVNKAASQAFQIGFDLMESIKDCKYPDHINKKLRATLLYYAVTHRALAYNYITQSHIKLVDDEILKGHMGIAASYLRIAKNGLDMVIGNKKYFEQLTPEQKEEFKYLVNNINKDYATYKEKNDRIYHQPEFDESKLPEFPSEEKGIGAVEPKEIKKKLDEEKHFEGFLPPELLALKQEFLNTINMKLLEVENNIKNANTMKNKLFAENYVSYFIDLINQPQGQKADVPPQLMQKNREIPENWWSDVL